MANKVKFGLSNVYLSKMTTNAQGEISYGTPFALPGAVNLSLDPAGESADFFADNTKYFSDSTNQGYTGTLEVALINDDFRSQILGQTPDTNGAYIENKDDVISPFALGCQFEGDSTGTRYWFYNCTVQRPNVASQTIETSKTPVTDTMNLTISARLTDGAVLAKMTKNDTNETAYNGYFSQVYEKSV